MPDHPLFARFYDRLTARTERAGLAEMRHRLLSSASGRVLELGAGTGHNLEHYTDAVTELVLAEPDPNMAKLLRERLAAGGNRRAARLRDRGAGRGASLRRRQLRRRRRDAGALHGRGPGSRPGRGPAGAGRGRPLPLSGARAQRHGRGSRAGRTGWRGPGDGSSGGCHPNRATDQLLAGAGFWIDSLERDKLPKAPPLVRPVIRGVAIRPSGVSEG